MQVQVQFPSISITSVSLRMVETLNLGQNGDW